MGVLPTPTERALPIGPPPTPASQCMQGGGREGPRLVVCVRNRGEGQHCGGGGSLGKATLHPFGERGAMGRCLWLWRPPASLPFLLFI